MSQKQIVRVVVGILQDENQQFFIAKRPPQVVLPGYWEFPGGKMEHDESQLQALIREFQEEVGIHVRDATYLKTFLHEFDDREIELHAWQIHTYTGIACGNEGQETLWADHTTLDDYGFLPSNALLLTFLKQRLNTHD